MCWPPTCFRRPTAAASEGRSRSAKDTGAPSAGTSAGVSPNRRAASAVISGSTPSSLPYPSAVLFPQRFHEGLRDDSITLTFRKWTRPQAKVGGRYRTGGGDLVVESIDQIAVRDISDAAARRAGA